jgi:hypothetical protein
MMKKIVEDRGDVLAVRATADDAVARLRQHLPAIRQRLANDQQPNLSNAERDLLLVAIAQSLGLL